MDYPITIDIIGLNGRDCNRLIDWICDDRSLLIRYAGPLFVSYRNVKGYEQQKFLLLHLKQHEKISRLAV